MKGLVEQAVQGDNNAFAELIQEYTQDMYKVARSILSNEADIADAMQETILKCYEHLGTLQKPQYFKTWLIRILINQCNEIVRKEKREWVGTVYEMDIDIHSPMDHWEFMQLLNGLEEQYRLVIILYYVMEFRVKEIAKLLHMSESLVKARLSRGRKCLRKMYGIGDGMEKKFDIVKRKETGGVIS